MAEDTQVKNRRINKADIAKVEDFIKGELSSRKDAQFRKDKEAKWKEIDRQLAMTPMERLDPTGKALPKSWHNVFELGELSKASEIIAADTVRITFPSDRKYFETHVEIELSGDKPDEVESNQRKVDGVLRSLMVQQQQDFGFKERFEVSIKEALHHGSYVAVVKWHNEKMVRDGNKVKFLGAPIWVPYSMWNAYPDPSPSVIPSGIFYQGSMMVIEYMPLWKLKRLTSEGWMQNQYHRIKESEKDIKNGVSTKDVELCHYYGDLYIDRKNEDGGIYLPNSHAITANGVLVYYLPNDLPFSPVIYNGYERQDIRDPYYTSPLEKQSPVQKIATICANKYLDGIALAVEPPGEYDANDPDYVANGGPVIAPGAQTPTRSMGKGWNTLKTGDPSHALQGLQMCLRQMQEGTGVSALRSGTPNSDRQTATEIQKVSQGSEVRTVDFVSKLEQRGIRPWLYMQHEFNRLYLEDYPFYNDEMTTPDYMRASKEDIDFPTHFDVVGSRGLLGEEQRTQRITQATVLFSQNPLFAPLLRSQDIMLDIYRDAGKKNPEEYVKIDQQGGQDPRLVMAQKALQEKEAVMQQQAQEIGKQIKQKEDALASTEEQIKKKASDVALKEQALRYQEELLNLKKQMDSFQEGEKAKREKASGDILDRSGEILQKADTVTPIIDAVVSRLHESQQMQSQAIMGLAQMLNQGNQMQAKILAELSKPKKVEVTRTPQGLKGSVSVQ